jgi:hypothetical protein
MEIKISDAVFKELMEWGLNGVPLSEITIRLKKNHNITINENQLISIIKDRNNKTT